MQNFPVKHDRSLSRPPQSGRKLGRAAVTQRIVSAALLAVTVTPAFSQLNGNVELSDLKPVSAFNDFGPVEKDRSNGEGAAGDGRPITLGGVVYQRGLGVHARSEIRYQLSGACSMFTSFIGVDDEVGNRGSVVFQVWADSQKLFESGILQGSSSTVSVSVSVAGRNELILRVSDAADGAVYDHADWAAPRLQCSGSRGSRYISDMTWISAVNGLGPVEKDRHNGTAVAGDGGVLTLAGRTYAKGLGVYGNSTVRYLLGGTCSLLIADVGLDDSVGRNGSAVFQVWADNTKLYDSGLMSGSSPTQSVSVALTSRQELVLTTTDGSNGSVMDLNNWANAQLRCDLDVVPPTVVKQAPASGQSAAGVTTAVSVTFSERVDPATLNTSTFYLTKTGSTTRVLASITWDATTLAATLRPSTTLDASSSYTALIKGGAEGVKDASGNALAVDTTWGFVTAAGGAVPPASQPLVIDGRQNVTISNVTIRNASGPCIEIRNNSQNIIVENVVLGPCGGAGISVSRSKGVIVRNSYIHDTSENAVTLYASEGLDVISNRMENVSTGVYALESRRVNITSNSFLNARGPMPRGQFVQFDKVTGPGNRIKCNTGTNIMGQSFPEDAISLYMTTGEAADPVQVVGNKIKGGGPSVSGGGIMMGDAGGSHQLVQDNILVDPGQYGIAVASGTNMTIRGNKVFAKKQSFSNVGIYVWNQYPSTCGLVTVELNAVNWTGSSGAANPGWDGGGCGSVVGWSNNTAYATFDESVIDTPIEACQQ